ncbi:MAG: TolC family protein, partial [Bacteroidota bacterium]
LNLLSNEQDIELVQQDIRIAKSNYLPSVNASLSGTYVDPKLAEESFGQNPEFSTSGTISVDQLVFSQEVKTNINIQEQLLKAQEQNYSTSQLDLIFDVTNAYLTALILKANAQIQIRNLDLTKRNLQISEQNFAAGQSGKSDVLRFQSEIAQNTQSLVEALNQLEQGFINLNQLLNNPVEMEIDVEDVTLNTELFERYNYDELTRLLDDPKLREPFMQFLIEEAFRNAPELKELAFNLQANQASIHLYDRGRYYPTVSLQGQYNRIFNRNGAGSETTIPNGNYNVGVNVSLPLYNQNLNNINEQIARVQKHQLNINQKDIKLAISANIRNNVFNLVNQISNIELSEVSERTAGESLELTQTAYSSGAVNIIQLIDAQNNFLNAQLSRTNAFYNFLIDALALERTMGYFFLLHTDDENEAFRQRFLNFTQE